MANTGTAVLDFGAAPGTNIAEVVITGQTGILSGSLAEAWMMAEATAGHNAYEHAVVPMKITCGSIVAGTGFTITGVSEWRLTGTFSVKWVWN